MKIYISHSTNFDYQTNLYDPLRANFSNLDIFFPHEKNNDAVDTKQIIKEADMILAEVSYPSTGQGIELGWADTFGIPVICMYRDGTKPSGALRIISTDIISYSSAKDLVEKIQRVIPLTET